MDIDAWPRYAAGKGSSTGVDSVAAAAQSLHLGQGLLVTGMAAPTAGKLRQAGTINFDGGLPAPRSHS